MTSERERTVRLPPLQITVSGPPDVAIVTLVGEVDLLSMPELDLTLHTLLAGSRLVRLDLDLAGVRFLDASGVSTILGAHATAARAGCRLRLLHPRRHVRRILDLTGLTEVCEIRA